MSKRRRTTRATRRSPAVEPVTVARRAPHAAPARAAWLERLLPLLVVAAGLYAYHNALDGPFVFDDVPAIPKNPTIRELSSRTLAPPAGSAVRGRPLVNLTLALNYAVGGLDVTFYHAFNVAVHLLAALTLFGIVRRTLRAPALARRWGADAPWLALAVALIWVVHPLASEVVTYVIQRTESLMGLGFLLTLYCALRGFEAGGHRGWFVAALIAFTAGLGCKEVIVVAPAIVLVYDRLFWSPSVREAGQRHAVLYAGMAAVLVLLVLFVTTRVRGALGVVGGGRGPVSPREYALTQCGVVLHYLRLAVVPYPLVADYQDWPIARSPADAGPAVLVVVALVGATSWALLRRRSAAFLGVWIFLILAPTSSFLPLVLEVVAERRMYLPLAAVVVLAVLGASAACRRVPRAGQAVLLALVVAAFAQTTVARNEAYRSTEAFWRDIVAKRPANLRARANLADYLSETGRHAEALDILTTTLRYAPTGSAHYELGVTLAELGRIDEAVEHYREALRLSPRNARAHNNLGNVLFNRGQLADAEEHYREAILSNGRFMLAHYNLGVTLARQGRTRDAIEYLERALAIDPDYALARSELARLRGGAPP